MTRALTRAHAITLIFGGLLCLPAFAQNTAAPAADSAEPEHLEQIVVTGSLIPRTNAETAEAVTVISADSLKEMGITTVEQALQQISANQSGAYQTGSSVSTFTGGGSYVSLRGLGASKTLVLIDGQRLANNVVIGNSVDVNGIPFAAIERIEVLREGASSLYGTDAIGGVINFITKKDYDGGEANFTYTQPQHPGGGGDNLDFTFGKGTLSTDGYNFLAAVNYTHNNELSATQRPFSATGFNPSKGLQNNNGPQGPFPGGYYDANNNLFQVGAPGCAGNPYLARVNGAPFNGYCAYEYSAAVDLIPKSSELSGLLSLSKTLPANNTLSLQYFYTLSKVTPWSGPEEYAGLTMNPSSPFYPTAGESTCVGCSASPALGGPISVGWTDPNNNRYFEDQNTEQRLLLTLTGDNLGWDYLVAGNYSRNHNINSAEAGFPNISVWAPGNVLSNLINPFGPQTAAGQALINSSYTNGVLETGELSLASLNGHVSHKLGDWFGAGHPSTIAVGFDIRDEHISYNPTSLAATLYSATFFAPIVITGGRREQAIYAELNVPVFKQFEFTVSDREDKYSDFGNTNNAKLALRYQPIEILTLRGAASTGFRAPSLVDLYSPQVLGAVAGTMLGPGCPAGSGPVFTASNCAAQGMGVYGGNPKLGPEKSDNIDLGFVLEPIKDLGITVDYYRITVKNEIQTIPAAAIYASPSVFGSDYSLNNAGTLTQAPSAPTACVNGPSTPSCGYIFLTTENTGGIRTSGFDLSANYLLRTAVGKVRVGLDGTLVTNYQLQEYEGAPWITLARQFNQGNQPIIGWQHLLTVDWTQGDWAAGLSNHYLSSYTDMYTASGQLWVGQGSGGSTVSSYSTWNAYGSWRPIKPLTVLVGVRNVFDTQPSFSNQTQNWQAGYNPLFSDPTGRAFYTKLKYVF